MKYLQAELVSLDTRYTTKDDVLNAMVGSLYSLGYIDNEQIFKREILKREALTPTAIGEHLAIPHARSISVVTPAIVVVRNRDNIVWEEKTGFKVNLIIMFAATDDNESSDYLQMLKKVATRLFDAEVLSALRACDDAEDFATILDV